MYWIYFRGRFYNRSTLQTVGYLFLISGFLLLISLPTSAFSATRESNSSPPTISSILQQHDPLYHTVDGSANNLNNPTWGSTNSQLLRLWDSPTISQTIHTEADYTDGISSPSGDDRPSPRAVSNAIAAQRHPLFNQQGVSDFFWQWGQFIDHDLDLTEPQLPHEPFPILVPLGDPFFDPGNAGIATISLNRSAYDPDTSHQGAPRQQINQITAWIDGSQIYGSTQERADWARTFVGGKLRMSDGNFLPFEEDIQNDNPLFGSGDVRVNEQIGLIALHTLFVREHNRLADFIAERRPTLTDEEIYQITRTIVAAEMQIISYEAFLPLLFGPAALPPYSGYKPQVNPNISNIFATGAYRFGHTMLPSTLLRLDENGHEIANGHLSLRNAFFNPQLVLEDGIEPILRGLAWQQAQEVDTLLVDDVRNFLFGPPGVGFDLAALNIQRGRDHGLPTYNAVRAAFGLSRIHTFAEITSDISLQNALATVYENDPNKIDLWVGGLAEDHLPDSLVGETYQAILADQFTRLRDGDRFWYQHIAWAELGFSTPNPVVQTDGTPLSEITLSKIIQWNTEISNIQADVFLAHQQMAQPIDLQISLSSASDPITPGQPLTYTIHYTNSGPANATNIHITDTLPFGLQFKAVISQESTVDGPIITQLSGLNQGQTVVWTVDSVDAGHSGTLLFTVETAANLGGAVLVNAVEINMSKTTNLFMEIDSTNNQDRAESIFQISGVDLCCPTAAQIVDFSAHREQSSVHLTWETAAEGNTLGFYIYRSTDDALVNAVPVLDEIMAGQGQLGGLYHWRDSFVVDEMAYHYWLVEMTTDGESISFGPISANMQPSEPEGAVERSLFFPIVSP